MRWSFAGKEDASPAQPRHMHARGETVDRLPTFARAFASARGILMVHTLNEGEELPSGKTKQWVVARASTTGIPSLSTIALAGMSTAKIEALSPEQIAAFTTTQVAALMPEQLYALLA